MYQFYSKHCRVFSFAVSLNYKNGHSFSPTYCLVLPNCSYCPYIFPLRNFCWPAAQGKLILRFKCRCWQKSMYNSSSHLPLTRVYFNRLVSAISQITWLHLMNVVFNTTSSSHWTPISIKIEDAFGEWRIAEPSHLKKYHIT